MISKVYNLVDDIVDFVVKNYGYVVEAYELEYGINVDTALNMVEKGLNCLVEKENDKD